MMAGFMNTYYLAQIKEINLDLQHIKKIKQKINETDEITLN